MLPLVVSSIKDGTMPTSEQFSRCITGPNYTGIHHRTYIACHLTLCNLTKSEFESLYTEISREGSY